jgi:hypothetical protein
MNAAEVVRIADESIYLFKGQHLNDLECSILEGVYEGKKYQDIAKAHKYSESHVTDVAAKLWRTLGKAIGERVTQSNLKSSIDRYQTSILSPKITTKNTVGINNINFCSQPNIDRNNPFQNTRPLRKRRSISLNNQYFYGREAEIRQVHDWVITEGCPIVEIVGRIGIGKTALVKQLLTQIEDKFDCIIWQSMDCQKPLADFIDRYLLPELPIELVPDATLDLDAKISLLLDALDRHACLIILDDFHQLFAVGESAGNYQESYRNYHQLFRKIGESSHQSCIVTLGWERSTDLEKLAAAHNNIHHLYLGGVDPVTQSQLLHHRGVTQVDRWAEKLAYYGGNPLYLIAVAKTVSDIFGAKINDFCHDDRLLLTNDIRAILKRQCDRLSASERQIINAIAIQNRAVTFAEIITEIGLPPAETIAAIASLQRRTLIDRTATQANTLFEIQPVLRDYLLSNSKV